MILQWFFYCLKKKDKLHLSQIVPELKKVSKFPTSFYETNIALIPKLTKDSVKKKN